MLKGMWGNEVCHAEMMTEGKKRKKGIAINVDLMKFRLVGRKGVYPYDFCTKGIRQLFKMKSLPPKKDFFNTLKDEPISDEDYKHAERVWKTFGCANMLDYTMLYCISDVYLLADAIHQLRHALFERFQLDMLAYLSFAMMSKQIMMVCWFVKTCE